jgi:carbon monoxide dehydrogenase subunit G
MATVQAKAQRRVEAPADAVFALVSNPARRAELLPEAYHDVTIGTSEQGQVVLYTLHAGGRERDYRVRIVPTEDEHVVTDTDELSSLRTEWSLEPDGDATIVRMRTTWQGAGGVGGFFERMFAPRGVARLHEQTLDKVAAAVRT